MGLTLNYMTPTKRGDSQDLTLQAKKKSSIMVEMGNKRCVQQHRVSDEYCLQAAL